MDVEDVGLPNRSRAVSKAFRQKILSMLLDNSQESTYLEYQSITATRERNPFFIGI
jgi:hypothetical protein